MRRAAMSQDAPTSSKRLFFPGLDEVRGLAALSVAVHHVALNQNRDGIPGLYRTFAAPCVSRLGANGVSIFFVLSGFLITYLLLTEKQRFGTIQLARFYMRRVLRIWPLYFLVIVLSFLILPILARSCEWLQGGAPLQSPYSGSGIEPLATRLAVYLLSTQSGSTRWQARRWRCAGVVGRCGRAVLRRMALAGEAVV